MNRGRFETDQRLATFQVRNLATPLATLPSSARIVNVNSISTQLNFRDLYNYMCACDLMRTIYHRHFAWLISSWLPLSHWPNSV